MKALRNILILAVGLYASPKLETWSILYAPFLSASKYTAVPESAKSHMPGYYKGTFSSDLIQFRSTWLVSLGGGHSIGTDYTPVINPNSFAHTFTSFLPILNTITGGGGNRTSLFYMVGGPFSPGDDVGAYLRVRWIQGRIGTNGVEDANRSRIRGLFRNKGSHMIDGFALSYEAVIKRLRWVGEFEYYPVSVDSKRVHDIMGLSCYMIIDPRGFSEEAEAPGFITLGMKNPMVGGSLNFFVSFALNLWRWEGGQTLFVGGSTFGRTLIEVEADEARGLEGFSVEESDTYIMVGLKF